MLFSQNALIGYPIPKIPFPLLQLSFAVKQFTFFPRLPSALLKLQWNGSDSASFTPKTCRIGFKPLKSSCSSLKLVQFEQQTTKCLLLKMRHILHCKKRMPHCMTLRFAIEGGRFMGKLNNPTARVPANTSVSEIPPQRPLQRNWEGDTEIKVQNPNL